MPKSGVVKTVDNFKKLMQGVEALTGTVVMVGVPDDKAGRREGEITNAGLAYVHDKGAPAARIPARPFMEPGVKNVQKEITDELVKAGKATFGGAGSVNTYLTRIGIITVRSIKNVISAGIPPPLAPSTIAGRIRRVKGKQRRAKIDAALAAGTPETRLGGAEGLFTPLVVTGQLRNAITYVLRKAKDTKK
jgi:hypothetical protein